MDVYNIFIDEAKYLNEFDTSNFDKSRQFFLINDENITESISNIIYCCDVIIFRYPQVSSKELKYFDFSKIRNLSKNIISVFGGGYQNLPNFNISKITKSDKLSIQDSNKNMKKY